VGWWLLVTTRLCFPLVHLNANLTILQQNEEKNTLLKFTLFYFFSHNFFLNYQLKGIIVLTSCENKPYQTANKLH
jgi:hypothetical protein